MYASKYGKRYGRRKALRKRTGGRRRKVSKVVKRYVKRAIHRTIENKERLNYGANQSIQTGQASTMTWPLLMAIDQGNVNGQRIGNQINIVRGLWKMTINLKPYDVTTNYTPQPTWVKVWVVKDLRLNGQAGTMDSVTFSNFFRGNNTGIAFQGNTLDTVFDVNKDYLRVLYSKLFKLGASSTDTANTNAYSYMDNSPFAKQITINYGKWARKQLKFNETSTYPNNDNLYLVVQAVPADGTFATGLTMIEMHYCNQMHYEDA